MINWKITRQENRWISQIAERASRMASAQGGQYTYLEALMDVTAVHANCCPLRLEELYHAADFNFSHDIGGIIRHLNRETGQLEGYFVPRYAQRY